MVKTCDKKFISWTYPILFIASVGIIFWSDEKFWGFFITFLDMILHIIVQIDWYIDWKKDPKSSLMPAKSIIVEIQSERMLSKKKIKYNPTQKYEKFE